MFASSLSNHRNGDVTAALRPGNPLDIPKARKLASLYNRMQFDAIGQPQPLVQVQSNVTSVTPSILPAEVFRTQYQTRVVSPLVTTVLDSRGRATMRAGDIQAALSAPSIGANNMAKNGDDFLAIQDRKEVAQYKRELPQVRNGLQQSSWMTYGMVIGAGLLILLVFDRM